MRFYLEIIVSSLMLIASRGDDNIGVVQLVPNLPLFYAELGGSRTVDCSVTIRASNTNKIDWKIPSSKGAVYTTSQKSKGGILTIYSTLFINDIGQQDLGIYKCTFGPSVATFKLEAPIEDKKEGNYTYGDKTTTLSCDIPQVTYKISKLEWLRNDTLISKLPDKERYTENVENRTLTITETTRKDADLYMLKFTFTDDSIPPYYCKAAYRAEPFVVKFDKSKNLIEDDTMELQCDVKGYPRAKVTWLKDKRVVNVTDDKRVMMNSLRGYENARLIIKNVKFDDAGDYTCRAHTMWFNQSVSQDIVVRVKDKLAALWPFLGIVGEVVILCTIIFIYEKRRNKQAEREANNVQDVDGSTSEKKEGLRHRNTSNNPTA